ncbi:MAG TPA: AAA family ATPase [Acetobacteraceae bacterium]|jgi:predicted ATPase
MLERIEIGNFRSIRAAQLELRALNVVIGPNGAGKSNLIGAFRLLDQIIQKRLREYVADHDGAARILHHGPKISPNLSMRFDFGANGYSFTLAPSTSDNLYFLREQTHFRGDYTPEGGSLLGVGHQEAMLPEAARKARKGVAHYVMQGVRDWVVYHFHDTSDTSPPKLMQDVDDNRTLRRDAANLAAFLYRLEQRHLDSFRRITEHVQRIAPFFSEFRVAPLAANPDKIKLEWRQRGSDAYFDGSSLSDGTLRFICLATLLLQPRHLMPSVILIDEPELGLHPAALTLLAEMLRDAAVSSQLLAATQSVTLLDHLTPEEVIVAEQEDGASTFRRLDEATLRDWMEDYGLGELWLKNVLGGRPQ